MTVFPISRYQRKRQTWLRLLLGLSAVVKAKAMLLPRPLSLKISFFKTPSDFRKWLAANHAKAKELWVGFYKKDSGKPSITWPESVDEALCFGWIDGIRKSLDNESYMIRFSPRKPGSVWSAVNIRNVERLIKEKRMAPV